MYGAGVIYQQQTAKRPMKTTEITKQLHKEVPKLSINRKDSSNNHYLEGLKLKLKLRTMGLNQYHKTNMNLNTKLL